MDAFKLLRPAEYCYLSKNVSLYELLYNLIINSNNISEGIKISTYNKYNSPIVMSLNKENPEVHRRLSRGRKPSRSHSDEKIDQSLEVLGFKSWKDLEQKGIKID